MNKTVLIILLALLVWSCRQLPSFDPSNELDPTNENFFIPTPQNFALSIDYRKKMYQFSWDSDNGAFFDGYLLTIDADSTFAEDPVEIKLPKNQTNYETAPVINTFKQFFKIQSYLDFEGNRYLSEPSGLSIDQISENIEVYFSPDVNRVEFYFYSESIFDVNIEIQESYNGNDFTTIYDQNISNSGNEYSHETDLEIEDYKYRVRLYTEDDESEFRYYQFRNREKCDTVEDEKPYFSPNWFRIFTLSDSSIKMDWYNFTYCVDQYMLYEGQNGSGRDWVLWQTIDAEANEFIINDLDTTMIYEFWVVGVVDGRISGFGDPIEVYYQDGIWKE